VIAPGELDVAETVNGGAPKSMLGIGEKVRVGVLPCTFTVTLAVEVP